MIGDAKSLDSEALLRERVAALEAELTAATQRADDLLAERDRLRDTYRHLEQVELQRRRLFVAKAERIDTEQLELEFAATLAKLNEIAGQLPLDSTCSSLRQSWDSSLFPRAPRRSSRLRADSVAVVTPIQLPAQLPARMPTEDASVATSNQATVTPTAAANNPATEVSVRWTAPEARA